MPRIIQIKNKIPIIQKKQKVAAYARVSINEERLLHSFSAQISYYSSLIQSNPAWEYAGVYSDKAITGTLMSKRNGFQQMIADCEAGKIDIILTKSISRFARNTLELLDMVRHLKSIGVEVRFEKEHISSFSGDGELMLTILASFAQEEVQSISDNVRWQRRKKIEAGEAPVRFQVTGYGWKDDKLVIKAEEATLIKRIYKEYLEGKSPGQICKGLNADGIKTIRGHEFSIRPVRAILKNPLYKGDLLLQKTFVVDPVSKVQKVNTGEVPMVEVSENHEPIIEPSTWGAVQTEMKRRIAEWEEYNRDFEGMRPFSHLVRCEKTGTRFRHYTYGKHSLTVHDGYWSCKKHQCPYREECAFRGVPDQAIRQACNRALDVDEFDGKLVREQLDYITVPKEGWLVIHKKDGSTYEDLYRGDAYSVEHQQMRRNCFSNKLICGICGSPYRERCSIREGGIRRVTWNCTNCGANGCINENVLKYRIKEAAGWGEFSFDMFKEKVEYIDMAEPCYMVIHFTDESEKEVEYYAGKEKRSWQRK